MSSLTGLKRFHKAYAITFSVTIWLHNRVILFVIGIPCLVQWALILRGEDNVISTSTSYSSDVKMSFTAMQTGVK